MDYNKMRTDELFQETFEIVKQAITQYQLKTLDLEYITQTPNNENGTFLVHDLTPQRSLETELNEYLQMSKELQERYYKDLTKQLEEHLHKALSNLPALLVLSRSAVVYLRVWGTETATSITAYVGSEFYGPSLWRFTE